MADEDDVPRSASKPLRAEDIEPLSLDIAGQDRVLMRRISQGTARLRNAINFITWRF